MKDISIWTSESKCPYLNCAEHRRYSKNLTYYEISNSHQKLFEPRDYVEYSELYHDDVIKWKHFPRYWPFARGLHRSPVNSPHKGQWRGALMFSLICAWLNGWVNIREAGILRRHRAHYDVIAMVIFSQTGRHSKWTGTGGQFRIFLVHIIKSLALCEEILSQKASNVKSISTNGTYLHKILVYQRLIALYKPLVVATKSKLVHVFLLLCLFIFTYGY